ncbi:MAG: hypothetical protein ACQEP7_02530 [bacterium]
MSRSILVQQQNSSQRELLVDIINSTSSRHIYELSSFDELVEISERQSSFLIFTQLEAENEKQVEWLEGEEDYVVGIINRRWEQKQLNPFIEAGLSDYILKPYQPDRLVKLVDNLSTFFESSPA